MWATEHPNSHTLQTTETCVLSELLLCKQLPNINGGIWSRNIYYTLIFRTNARRRHGADRNLTLYLTSVREQIFQTNFWQTITSQHICWHINFRMMTIMIILLSQRFRERTSQCLKSSMILMSVLDFGFIPRYSTVIQLFPN